MGRHGNQPSKGTVGSGEIADGAIVNADINASAAIVGSKLDLSTPGAIGGSSASTIAATTITASSTAIVTGAASLDGGFDTGDNNTLKFKVVDIGDWNMDATASVTVAHGLTVTTIRSVQTLVRNDDDTLFQEVDGADGLGNANGFTSFDATNVTLGRVAARGFDNVAHDATSYNRGWIMIWYTG